VRREWTRRQIVTGHQRYLLDRNEELKTKMCSQTSIKANISKLPSVLASHITHAINLSIPGSLRLAYP